VIVPVGDIERATRFYQALLADAGRRVSSGRHYFDCGGTILACYDPRADGDDFDARANQEHLYFAVEHLENVFVRARSAMADSGGRVDERIETRPWRERSFYMSDRSETRCASWTPRRCSRGRERPPVSLSRGTPWERVRVRVRVESECVR
jgi:hypothetical protein